MAVPKKSVAKETAQGNGADTIPEFTREQELGALRDKRFARLTIDVGPQFGGIGFGVVLGEVGGGVDDLAHLGVDRL